jgi:secretion/DNA translocation related TadE-like protein
VWVLGATVAVAVFGLTSVYAAGAVLARHRAQAAADLGALAAASRAIEGPAAACAAAAATVVANGATITDCRLDGLDATVTTTAVVAGAPPGVAPATATARAGPAAASLGVGPAETPAPFASGPAQRAGSTDPIASRTASSTRTAPSFDNGSFPLPHLGDWTQEGQPWSHAQAAIASRVARSHSAAT